MTAALGTVNCGRLGCTRRRYVSPLGVTYGNCWEHTSALLTAAFGEPRTTPAPRTVTPVAVLGGAVVRSTPAA